LNPSTLLFHLKTRGISLWVDDGKLRYKGPKGAITEDLRIQIKHNKSQLLDLLNAAMLSKKSVPLTSQARAQTLPLSFAQQRLWFLDQWQPNSAVYNISAICRLRGVLHVEALQGALGDLVARQEALRTIFPPIEDGARQHIQSMDEEFRLPLTVTEIEDDLGDSPNTRVEQLIAEETTHPFDLAHGPLFRVRLVILSTREAILMLTLHHIIADGWSMGVLWRELGLFYDARVTGTPADLPPLPIHYADYAVWQRQWLQGDVLAQQVAYWQEQLSEAPPSLALLTDYARPSMPSYRGGHQRFTLSASLTHQLKTFSQQERGTLFMTGLAAFQLLLARYTGEKDIVVGTPIANRTRQEIEGLIGFFVNTLVLRTRLTKTLSFRQLLHQVRTTCLEAYRHQDLPFEKLVEVLQPERDSSRHPLFQVMFQLDQEAAQTFHGTGFTSERLPVPDTIAKFDLSLALVVQEDGIQGTINYSTDLFADERITRLIGHFHTLLEGLVAEPDQTVFSLPLLTAAELHQLVEWNRTDCAYPLSHSIHELFEAQVARTPDAIAVVYEDEQLTYAQLNARANQLAHYLGGLGIGPEVRVAVCLERSINLVGCLLAILKAGGTYVPIDPSYPHDRIALMLENAEVTIIVTQQSLLGTLPPPATKMVSIDTEWTRIAQEATTPPPQGLAPENLAYMIYTSGSTGTPKGVQVPHRAFLNFLEDMIRNPGLGASDRLLAVTSLSFDIAGLELWLPVLVGGQVVLASREMVMDGAQLIAALETHEIAVMQATPATWQLLTTQGWKGRPNLQVLCGGEQMPLALAHQFLEEKGHEVWNLYGPTETTVWSTRCAMRHDVKHISIGRPIANTQIYVEDRWRNLVPIGVRGELFISGEGVARGYWGRPDVTAERFVPNPYSRTPGARRYRTGDEVRYRADGQLEWMARLDHQVKLRGFRIELGEIEAVLQGHSKVCATVVLCREDFPGEKQLVAYIVGQTSASDLRPYLQDRLPVYMLPSAFVVLDQMPLTPNGKVDRRALPAPDQTHRVQSAVFTAPRTYLEELVATIWIEVLHLEQVGIHDNFFKLGGHSLLATQLLSRLNQRAQIDLSLRTLFDYPILADQANAIEELLLQEMAHMPDSELDQSTTP